MKGIRLQTCGQGFVPRGELCPEQAWGLTQPDSPAVVGQGNGVTVSVTLFLFTNISHSAGLGLGPSRVFQRSSRVLSLFACEFKY